MAIAVVLMSGGLDSTTLIALAQSQGFDLYGLSFHYGQRHVAELQAAEHLAATFGIKHHRIVTLDTALFAGSALTDASLQVPKHRSMKEIGVGVPSTYVPARNTIFLSFALAWLEVLAADDIFIGVNAQDCSGYPDCRPQYIEAYQRMANLAVDDTKARNVHIHTPLLHMSKAQIIETGIQLGVDYSLTLSCYDPVGLAACGGCDACLLRAKGFAEAGIPDPTVYHSSVS